MRTWTSAISIFKNKDVKDFTISALFNKVKSSYRKYLKFYRIIIFISILSYASADQHAFFENKVRPLLAKHCTKCHSQKSGKRKGGLYLDSKQAWQIGGDSGPAVIPKDLNSLLLHAVEYHDPDLQMPPKYKLGSHEIAILKQWVMNGAFDPRESSVAINRSFDQIDIKAGKKFWSFQPIKRPPIPKHPSSTWPQSNIDHFIYAKLKSKGLKPQKDTEAENLIKRIYFDLTGLPPKPKQIKEFEEGKLSKEKLIDKLLASPEFGEHWGRHWLDIARFAESSGGGRSIIFKEAWRYRDYVIASFNQDKAYDQFLLEQIAGDLIDTQDPEQRNTNLIAAGYLMLGANNYELQDKTLLKMEVIDEQIRLIGKGVLGLTLGCVRCHDHPFDPISSKDYYALAGIFASTKSFRFNNVSEYMTQELNAYQPQSDEELEWRKKYQIMQDKRNISQDKQEIENLNKKLKQFIKKKPGKTMQWAISVKDHHSPQDTHVLIRGGARNLGPKVKRGFIRVVQERPQVPQIMNGQSGRYELAKWLGNKNNPLTARVAVNRIWKHLFSEGLVRTVDNFGQKGQAPTHPELLDYLAARFIEKNWSFKSMIREVMLSRTYQLSSTPSRDAKQIDPTNHLLSHTFKCRLGAESIRDAMLYIAGNLDPKKGGYTMRNVKTYDWNYQYKSKRRSVYLPVFRNSSHDLFEVFDIANNNLVTGKRNISTVSTQSLYMMNHPFVYTQSEATAIRLVQKNCSIEENIQSCFTNILGRKAHKDESIVIKNYLEASSKNKNDIPLKSWSSLCHSLFSSIDFRYLH